ncbi:tetratricopeptide repeat protein [Sinimarinibacterium thermocellulolyticum]|uniref:Tetratricopeptide repeat protein n=1 Tax=Sinimarinibacterium thermocellulolyticum TaxID=3170016 RepID=A0ABV2AAT2_9GAMM
MRKTILMLGVLLGLFSPALLAEESAARGERTVAMREATFKQLSKARELAERDEHAEAIAILTRIADDRHANGYEKAQAYYLLAFCHYERGDNAKAIAAYEQVLQQQGVPDSLRAGTQYAIAQMYMATEQWAKAAAVLEQWFQNTEAPSANAYVLLGQAYFQLKQYDKAKRPIERAIVNAKNSGERVKENWLLLLRSIYYESGDYRNMMVVLKDLAALYPKREYWLQLAAVYGELDDPKRQLAAMLAAYDQGYFERGQDYVGLAQLLLGNDVPYRAAKVLQEGIDKKLVEADAQHLNLLADAYVRAKDYEAAIEVLRRAAHVAGDGESELRLAQALMEQGQWREAAEAARRAIDKGGLRRPDIANVVLGLALYELNQLPAAQAAFAKAAEDERSRTVAEQWAQFIAREQERMRAIAAFGSSV